MSTVGNKKAATLTTAYEPLPEERMEETHRLVPSLDQEAGEELVAAQEVLPAERRGVEGEGRHRLVDLHQGQRLQGGQAHRQNIRHLRGAGTN